MSNAAQKIGKKSVPDMSHQDIDVFRLHIDVSYETIHKLTRYAEMLREWNGRFNLVSESTLPHIWTRHFLDSAQLFRFISKEAKIVADLGSGAGFPGLVLSILGIPGITLVESIGKKADFLRAVIADLELDAKVRQQRIEEIRNLKADIITARALKPLPELLKFVNPLIKKDSVCLFLKGKNLEDELTESSQWWKFSPEKHASLSDPSGNVLIIRDLQYKNAAPRNKHLSKRK